MGNKAMSYLETFNYLKRLNKEQKLYLIKAGYDYLISVLEKECNNNKITARNLLIMILGTFMLADKNLEKDDLDLLEEFFSDSLTLDELIHILRIGYESNEKIIKGCESIIKNNDKDFLDNIIIIGIIVCSNNGEISKNEKLLAVRYLKVLY